MPLEPLSSRRGSRSGLVKCTRCPWRGVPTYINGQAQNQCPACKGPVETI